jgi:hypothetical protein
MQDWAASVMLQDLISESKRFALTIKNLEKFIMQMSDLLLSVKLLFQFYIELVVSTKLPPYSTAMT